MRRIYVDITDVPESLLEFLGYYRVASDDGFTLYNNKGDAHIVHTDSKGHKYIYVEDINDAHALANRPIIVVTSEEDKE